MEARCKEKGSVPPLRIALEAPSIVCQNGYRKGNRRQHDTNSDRTTQPLLSYGKDIAEGAPNGSSERREKYRSC